MMLQLLIKMAMERVHATRTYLPIDFLSKLNRNHVFCLHRHILFICNAFHRIVCYISKSLNATFIENPLFEDGNSRETC